MDLAEPCGNLLPVYTTHTFLTTLIARPPSPQNSNISSCIKPLLAGQQSSEKAEHAKANAGVCTALEKPELLENRAS